MVRRLDLFAFAFVMAMSPLVARAQPSENAVAAETLFDAGRADVEKGDFANACPKFAQSQKLDPAAGTLINLADCEEHLGHLAAAWLAWREAVERLPLDDARLPAVTARRDAIDKRVPRLTIHLRTDVRADAIVKKDDVDLPRNLLDVPLPVDPGHHTIVLSANGRIDSRYVAALTEGARETITVELGPPVVAGVPANPPVQTPDDSHASASSSWLGWGALAVGAIGIGLGTTTGILAIDRKSEQENNCFPIHDCTPAGADAARDGRTFATVSTVSFIAGAVALAAGVYLVVFRSPPKRGASAGAM
jgi:hypothetical protein